ncbi:uncharacterized protein LOC123676588 isoform X2 [Harmonia axyridis]|uniref:uncharacterized protein LOC123676588 isoform X2 n=1 Tax=Harmonia axyridis TaxID=115357 RepID=UPI001E27558B|nr:uncharacterized protein LOC123676588 isoform X2 [Harmonia axyridis]
MKSKRSIFGALKHAIPTYIWMFLFAAAVFILTLINLNPKMVDYLPETSTVEIEDFQKGYLIKTPGCKIPELPLNNTALQHYFEYQYKGAHCNQDRPPLVDSNLTSLHLLDTSFQSYNISDRSSVRCCYKELKRKEPQGKPDKQFEFGETCNYFEESITVEEEFVQVLCYYREKEIYQDLFAFVPRKSNVAPDVNREKLNVLIIGIDGISRINFHRQMPKTVATLKTLGFQEFLGYNKIADNTYPNLIAVLTGDDEQTIEKSCRSTGKYFDNCNLIWKHFKNNSYLTSFAEDSAWMGLFNYQKYGFQKQPTDYVWGFFDRIAEDMIGNSQSMNVIQCIGAREDYKMIVKYVEDFVHQMNHWKLPYLSFSWSSSLSHDFVNKPRIGDQFYSDSFQNMYNKGHFENTVVIVMSDHGIRFGSFRQTYQGRIEERLPFLFVRLPLEFKERYPHAVANLRTNLRRLTTPFDLHETLYDLAHVENMQESGGRYSRSRYGLSLFSKIPSSRTCEDAGITDHWCTCLESQPVGITPEVKYVTIFTINYLNSLLKGYAQCSKLRLKTIRNAQILSHAEKTLKSKVQVKDYLVSFETLPGDGSFEATVRIWGTEKLELIGTVSRLNLYGKQSACITDFHLKLYCYCKDMWS